MISTLCTLLTLLPAPQKDIAPGPLSAHYTVSAVDAVGDGDTIPIRVEIRVEHPPRPRIVFQIPVWTPGSYRLRDFPERIHEVRAVSASGSELPVDRLHRNTWQVVHGGQSTVRLSYRVDLTPSDRFMMREDDRRCLTYEGPGVYMYVRGHKDRPCHVRFDLPKGWSVASGLVDRGGGLYFAQDYDFLADCPVKMGEFFRYGFESHGVPIDVVVDASEDLEFEHEEWIANIQKITDVQGEIFGGFPFDRYTFLYTVSRGGGGGGLEHLTSTAIGLSARSLEKSAETGMGVTAHEFFHLWNVKRIRPRALGPFDYTRPVRTTALWLMEGVTSYYTDVTLARAGLETPEEFWEAMARQIGRLESSAGRDNVSSAQASLRTWDSTPPGDEISYYNSGLVLGLLLDLEIRAQTRNRRSLDDFMRALYALCRDRGAGFDDAELVTLVDAVTGGDYGEWFDRHVYGTQVPPYSEILAHAGMRYVEERTEGRVMRGLRGIGNDDMPFYADPTARGAAQLRRSGRITAVGDVEVETLSEVKALVKEVEPGVVELAITTPGGASRTVKVRVEVTADVEVVLEEDEQAGSLAHAIREGIVTGVPGRPGG